jgi:hypothetical protein
MNEGRLYLSFWHLCLANLPVGAFAHRCITSDEARSGIERARQEGRLVCVSEDDLLAPYRKRQRENHEAMCKVLEEHFGIALSMGDFLSKDESDEDSLYSIIPLNCVEVHNHDTLLVITCHYVLGEKKAEEPLPFEIEPTTVEFHLIEAA